MPRFSTPFTGLTFQCSSPLGYSGTFSWTYSYLSEYLLIYNRSTLLYLECYMLIHCCNYRKDCVFNVICRCSAALVSLALAIRCAAMLIVTICRIQSSFAVIVGFCLFNSIWNSYNNNHKTLQSYLLESLYVTIRFRVFNAICYNLYYSR